MPPGTAHRGAPFFCIWPFVGGFWVMALAAAGQQSRAKMELAKVARANALGNREFNEWLHSETLLPAGLPGQSWNAAAFLAAYHAVKDGRPLFEILRPALKQER